MASILTSISDLIASIFKVVGSIFSQALHAVEGVSSMVVHFFTGLLSMVQDVFVGLAKAVGGVGNFVIGMTPLELLCRKLTRIEPGNVVVLSIIAAGGYLFLQYQQGQGQGREPIAAKKRQ
ncbi:hypothetical protein P152DRAFT_455992 [Eremomyces bilateralis CBS 781.70]|uniref:Uncharacterized protein n=1 Tax=Eremomyces bilateralis CBS 781.70 TaxID=1392243 RepID=A0A6G1GA43_9PEZI|nr:uncharacterized protein P152DRAFT_455992 [Eremomyces bilateralis CBS 781.70]KAF1814948.1 hypothetical protein P152DRAFT_455992 [Eremomyces bilateralis CBS 781.70]